MSNLARRAAALLLAGTATTTLFLGTAGAANADTPTPDTGTATTAEPGDNWQEYQCSEGILGTGLLCNSAPAPGPAPEDDPFQGGPLGSDSTAAETLRTILGGGLFR